MKKRTFMNPYNNPAMRDPQVQTQIFVLFLTAIIALWVVNDARTRGKDGWLAFWWGFGTLMVLPVALPLWFIVRPKTKSGATKNDAFSREPTSNPRDAFS